MSAHLLRALLLIGVALPVAATAEQVDVGCSMPWWNMAWNAPLLGPIAQDFVAAADRMDFVDLLLAEGQSNSNGVQVALALRAGELSGPVLATSTVLDLADGADGYFRFRFDPPVPLLVGATYLFEIRRVSDTGYLMVRGANDDPCPDGHGWIEGAQSELADLWFALGREVVVGDRSRSWGALKSRFRS